MKVETIYTDDDGEVTEVRITLGTRVYAIADVGGDMLEIRGVGGPRVLAVMPRAANAIFVESMPISDEAKKDPTDEHKTTRRLFGGPTKAG